MDLNFSDLKKEAAATVDDIFTHTTNVGKQVKQAVAGGGSSSNAGQQDDNAHTEQYFANEQKDFDFEHVDPQTFVQQLSAGAKEAQEQLDAKFAQKSNEFDDFLTHAAQDLGSFGTQVQKDTEKNLASWTSDFMKAERGFSSGDLPKEPAKLDPLPEPNLLDADVDLLTLGKGDGQFAPTAPLAPIITNIKTDQQSNPSSTQTSTTSNKDSDTDSASVSYNPSPVKKNPVADALKEQDNEKFISSEDLLGDFKEERTATPDFQTATAAAAVPATAAPASIKTASVTTTDLDADEDFIHATQPVAHSGAVIKEAEKAQKVQLPPAIATPPTVVQPVAHSAAEFVEEEKATKVQLPPKSAIGTPPPTPVAVSEPIKSQPSAAAAKPNVAKEDESKVQPNIIYVEELFYKYGLDAWFKPERLHPKVESLIYWRDVKKSGIVFGAGLVILLAISCFSVISVFAYLSLLTLFGTVAFRIYKSVMQAIQKTSDGHPFKEYLEIDLTLSQEKVQNIAGVAVAHLNGFTAELRRLFLVEDLVDSIKFGVILWVMTYLGAWFNGMTLVILAFVSLFTLPKVYENNKQSIDTYLDLVRSKLTEITDKIKVAIPIGNKKPIAETEKDK